ncbi:MAG: hypothetical protein ABGY95_12570 [Rubritalea sp.]|uniref:hypothetical protein n=1 Tax=Rubritalea sp. TaxID=2109375 RepID=UPI003242D767
MSKSTDNKSARKFWWIIMILPIGLVIGTVTSVINHLRQNEEKEAQLEFKVAVALNAKDIQIAMERAQLLGERNLSTKLGRKNTSSVSRFIQGSVSPGGTGIQFTKANTNASGENQLQLAYADIEGAKKNEFVAVVIELIGEKGQADTAKLGLTPSLIRSLAEANPTYTLRFILSPETQSASKHAQSLRRNTLSSEKQKLHKVIVLKEQDSVDISDPNDWKTLASRPAHLASMSNSNFLEITHPVLRKQPTGRISPELSKATLKAADQLRMLILKLAD